MSESVLQVFVSFNIFEIQLITEQFIDSRKMQILPSTRIFSKISKELLKTQNAIIFKNSYKYIYNKTNYIFIFPYKEYTKF